MLLALNVLNGPSRNFLYEHLFLGEHVRFQYPTSSLLPLVLLNKIGLSGLRTLNAINSLIFGVNAAGIAFFGWLLFSQVQLQPSTVKSDHSIQPLVFAVIAAISAFLFWPLLVAANFGQIQLWIDLCFTGVVICWVLDRRFLSGLLIGIACAIKPQMSLLVIWALLWREWALVVGFALSFVPVTVVSIVVFGFHNYFAYVDVVHFLTQHGERYYANSSINGILNWYFFPGTGIRWEVDTFTKYVPAVYIGTLLASLLSVAVILVLPLINRGRRADISDLSVAAICTVVGSPVAWEHHYGILLPLYIVVLRQVMGMAAGLRRTLAIISIILSWVLVANFIPFASFLVGTPFVFVQAYRFFGALVLLFCFLFDSQSVKGSRAVSNNVDNFASG